MVPSKSWPPEWRRWKNSKSHERKTAVVEKRNRINELIELLNEASKAYYQESREIMSNYEYDKLYDELEALEKEAD